jgi:hypothetical protein
MNSQINISDIFMGYIETLHTLSKTGTVLRYIVILIESSEVTSCINQFREEVLLFQRF